MRKSMKPANRRRVKVELEAMTKRYRPASWLILVGCLLNAPVSSVAADVQLSDVDRPAPEFKLDSTEGEQWQLPSLAGKPWVINFWATWCPPCVEEIPSMNRAWQVLEPRGIGMLAINAGEGESAVLEFLDKIAIEFPTLLGSVNTLANWSVRALPTTLVIDRNGQVVFEALGPREWDDEQLLARVIDLVD